MAKTLTEILGVKIRDACNDGAMQKFSQKYGPEVVYDSRLNEVRFLTDCFENFGDNIEFILRQDYDGSINNAVFQITAYTYTPRKIVFDTGYHKTIEQCLKALKSFIPTLGKSNGIKQQKNA